VLVEIIGGGTLQIVPSGEIFIVHCMDSEFDGNKNLLCNGHTDCTPFLARLQRMVVRHLRVTARKAAERILLEFGNGVKDKVDPVLN
jgi:hypothetical protein